MASDARPMVLGFESYCGESNIRPCFILQGSSSLSGMNEYLV